MDAINYAPHQAITVRFKGSTNHRGARYVASCESNPHGVVVGYDYGLTREQNLERAAAALVSERGWYDHGGTWVGGGTADGAVFVFVRATEGV